ncbi:LacI family DNA-binding transcriptional regulator [Streptomyces boncukensis]|uniref:LacI family transcriptional regulator n=1 Tax=Streptomyces boncukensis TaxID=2711219 RepID=A0A6G4WYK2_9ACTN|nr:LacI family DNA-binding transcriptional regulator [Streptomyces boncukensis]NGO70366.1 LacI family transcriptional regulator [Streptomyces boncukensis]
MADVAERVGVSRALVSLVFRNQPGAGEETRERVLRAADELGYQPDTAARLLARGRSRTLGVVITVHQPFQADLVEALYPAAERLGYDVLLSAHLPGLPGRDERRAAEALLSHRCEGVILLGHALTAAQLEALGGDTVAVAVSRSVPGARIDCVRSAEGQGVRQAMDHLVQLGHRDIVHLDGGDGPGSAERSRAYRAAMRAHGLTGRIRILPGAHTREAGVGAGELLLTEGRLPTAVLAGNDTSAMGLLMVLMRAGVDVPAEISVVGYDDSHVSHLLPVGLTTVRQDAVALAERAVRFAVDRLEGEGAAPPPREAVLEPRLVVRGTTAPPRV